MYMEREDLKRPRIKRTGEIIFYKKTVSSLKKGRWMNTSSPQVIITNRRIIAKVLWIFTFLQVPLYKIKTRDFKQERIGHSVKIVYENNKIARFYFLKEQNAKEFYDALTHAKGN
jgi:hypothetical protein